MPLFDFRCKSCHQEFEALCKNHNAEGVACPTCGTDSPSRLLSRFAVSQQLSPCGTSASERTSGCGYNPQKGGCGRCSN